MFKEREVPSAPFGGEMFVSVGAGFWTWNAFEYDAVPYELVTVTSRKPVGADALMAMAAESCVGDETVTELTVMSELLNPTLVLPDAKLVPTMVTLMPEPRVPDVGETEVIVGTGIGAAAVHEENESIPPMETECDDVLTAPPTFVQSGPPDSLYNTRALSSAPLSSLGK